MGTVAELIADNALSPLSVLELRLLGGAMARASERHGALATLNGAMAVFASGPVFDADAAAAIADRVEHLRTRLSQWIAPQALLNSSGGGVDPAQAFDDDAGAPAAGAGRVRSRPPDPVQPPQRLGLIEPTRSPAGHKLGRQLRLPRAACCTGRPPWPRCSGSSPRRRACGCSARGTPSRTSPTRTSWCRSTRCRRHRGRPRRRARSRSPAACATATSSRPWRPRGWRCTTSPRCRTSPWPARWPRPRTARATAAATWPRRWSGWSS